MVDKKKLVKTLIRIADLMELKGENQFKVKAFKNGANVLRSFTGELADLVSGKEKVKGIGKGLISVIEQYLNSEIPKELETLESQVSQGILELSEIKGLSAGKIRFLNNEFNVKNVDDLEKIINEGKLNGVKNFGGKTIEKLKKEIEFYRKRRKFFLINQAEQVAEQIVEKLKSFEEVKKIQVTGELRRGREIIEKVEILALLNESSSGVFEKKLNNLFRLKEINLNTLSNSYKILEYEKIVFLYFTEDKSEFVKLNFILTGSKDFTAKFDVTENYKNEKEIFKKNQFPYVIPEMREHTIDELLVYDSDLCFSEIKGMLHFHTIRSDGYNTLEQMVSAGKNLGFEYFAVCDHSKSAYYANGLKENELEIQKSEVAEVSQKLNVPVLHGNETDILPDGSLDFSNEILASLDFVVASVHSSFNLSEEEMTRRIIKAVENPYVCVLGHPTGRLLLRRDAYAVNIKKVIDACAENKVAIEINANPYRLDLDWRLLDYAKSKGAIFAINADAHSTPEIEYTKYGVKIARKGGLQQDDVINFWDYERLRKFFSEKNR